MRSQKTRRMFALYLLFGGSGIFFFIAGMAFKILHWPGASLTLVTGSLLLIAGSVFYAHFKSSREEDEAGSRDWEEEGEQQGGTVTKRTNYFYCAAVCLVITGALFKIMYWPGSNYILIAGLLVFAGDFIRTAFKKNE